MADEHLRRLIVDPDPDAVPEIEREWLARAGLRPKSSYRVQEVARLLDVSIRDIYYMLDDGRLARLEFPANNHPRPSIKPTRIPYQSLIALLPIDLKRRD